MDVMSPLDSSFLRLESRNMPWAADGVDIVIESTGKFRTRDPAAAHLAAGAAKVLISAPGQRVDATIVMGVNDASNDPKGPRRARTAAVNIIPTTTGAARAVSEVIPAVAGLLDGVALRVPVVDGSLVDLTVELGRDVTAREVNETFRSAAAHGRPLYGRLRYTTDPIVSTDVIGDPASCIFDSDLTQTSGRMAKVFGWYDNEWGYTARLVDLTRLVGRGLSSSP